MKDGVRWGGGGRDRMVGSQREGASERSSRNAREGMGTRCTFQDNKT